MTSLMTQNQHKIENYVIIASLKSETMGKLINRMPSSCLLISSSPGSVLKTHVESLGKADKLRGGSICNENPFIIPSTNA